MVDLRDEGGKVEGGKVVRGEKNVKMGGGELKEIPLRAHSRSQTVPSNRMTSNSPT